MRSLRNSRGGAYVRVLAACALVLLAIPLLSTASGAADFSNTTAIQAVRGTPPSSCPATSCPAEKANPYPSNISVTGLSGPITDVNVTLKGLTYGDTEGGGVPDVDMMLVAPDGKAVMLMSDACGNNNNRNQITTPIDLTFDDSASQSLPANDPCVAGTYKPIDDDGDGETLRGAVPQPEDGFPAPAPTPPASTLPLSTFNGSSANGTWSLYMVDDGPSGQTGIDGQFAGGWSLAVTTDASAATTSTTVPSGSPTTTVVTCAVGPGLCAAPVAATTTVPASTTTTVAASPAQANSSGAANATPVEPGGGVVIAGGGLPPNSTFNVSFHSVPVLLGTITTNAQGGFSKVFTVPATAQLGAHRMVISDAIGQELAAVALNVVKPGGASPAAKGGATNGARTLVRTGIDSADQVLLAGISVLIGALLLSWRRVEPSRRGGR